MSPKQPRGAAPFGSESARPMKGVAAVSNLPRGLPQTATVFCFPSKGKCDQSAPTSLHQGRPIVAACVST